MSHLALYESSLYEQILDAFPSGSYALTGFLRLLDIVETDQVLTAAVECRAQPRLLINPEFVEQHAATPEKLLMLVMHELHHVLLGHTTLFPRANSVQNFVFDAVINGIVCRMFPDSEYTSFFMDFYSDNEFPECLLRPPEGWLPGGVAMRSSGLSALPEELRARALEVHAALYSETGASYHEVYSLLPETLAACGLKEDPAVPLLGDHREENGSSCQLENASPLLFDIVRDLVEQWPQPPDPIRGRSLADVLKTESVSPIKVRSNRSILRGLLLKVAKGTNSGRVRRVSDDRMDILSPMPSFCRRSLVQRALGGQPLLYAGSTPLRRRCATGAQVHVYLDVSGSMESVLSALYGAVLDCREMVHPAVHLFSTKISDISLNELKAGKCRSTGGTDIACVAEHMARFKIRRAVLVTDGWVGTPEGEHKQTLLKARLGVAYLGPCNQTDLQAVADHKVILTEGK